MNPDEAFVHLDSKDWESGFEKNRLAMYRVNCWGAPTFKLFHKRKNFLSHGDKIVFGLLKKS
ncbi:MAG: hypothetical protein Ct9H90mP15_06060 [Candidatus Neomarinimicrobiota bacterium]|nr:MAG: hypothetical protein Ct9H90mP15_06060 [Candidatus Neomarinimicrobiota bacterium]